MLLLGQLPLLLLLSLNTAWFKFGPQLSVPSVLAAPVIPFKFYFRLCGLFFSQAWGEVFLVKYVSRLLENTKCVCDGKEVIVVLNLHLYSICECVCGVSKVSTVCVCVRTVCVFSASW